MKQKVITIISLCLVLAAIFSFAACNRNKRRRPLRRVPPFR